MSPSELVPTGWPHKRFIVLTDGTLLGPAQYHTSILGHDVPDALEVTAHCALLSVRVKADITSAQIEAFTAIFKNFHNGVIWDITDTKGKRHSGESRLLNDLWSAVATHRKK
jgi:hypothetical protein